MSGQASLARRAGIVAALFVIHRYLPDTPVLRRLMLKPPDEFEQEEIEQRESLVDYEYLLNKRGVAITPLHPAGKARFGDERVEGFTLQRFLDEVGKSSYVVGVSIDRCLGHVANLQVFGQPLSDRA